ncbi:MAG: diacylglycerol/lipid kinase family protein [Thermodesulfobacteriota bacterium]
MKVLFIVNPAAGGRQESSAYVYNIVSSIFGHERGFFRVKETSGAGHAGALAREALSSGFECVVACGGDGTVNEVAGVLVGSPALLGILPLGAANSLARGLNIPLDPAEAMGLIKGRTVRGVDAGIFCGRFFFGSAGFGLDGDFARKYKQLFFASKPREFYRRHPGALREFLRHKDEELSIKVDNALLKVRSLSLAASNVENYGGPAIMAPGADPGDGLIELSIMPAMGPLSVPGVWRKLLGGTISSLKGFRSVRGREILIPRGGYKTEAHVDGEPFDWIGDIEISSVQRGLKVLTAASVSF